MATRNQKSPQIIEIPDGWNTMDTCPQGVRLRLLSNTGEPYIGIFGGKMGAEYFLKGWALLVE